MSERNEIDLAGGYDPDELRAIRRLARSLAADGYDVAKVALSAGGRPAALVYEGRSSDPFRTMIVAARTFLRAAEVVEGEDLMVSPEELETLAALRTTARVAAERAVAVEPPEVTVGTVAHVDFARAALRGERDAED